MDPENPISGGPSAYRPTMTGDYSRISATARAVEEAVWPDMAAYLDQNLTRWKNRPAEHPFVIADYGSADGVNSSRLFEKIIGRLRDLNPAVRVKVVYNDLAEPALFDDFWRNSALSRWENVEAVYIRRSFYRAFPELNDQVDLGFSSTAMHWLDTTSAPVDLFQHPECLQPNQMPAADRRLFVEKWQSDWQVFLNRRAEEMATSGLLYMAALADLGGDCWPASAGYNELRDICRALHQEGAISADELRRLFIPDYFATPLEMQTLVEAAPVRDSFCLAGLRSITVPCAYYNQARDRLNDNRARRNLADDLARVVRAWSESSLKVGLAAQPSELVDRLYRRLADRFYFAPAALPYQYCLLQMIKK